MLFDFNLGLLIESFLLTEKKQKLFISSLEIDFVLLSLYKNIKFECLLHKK